MADLDYQYIASLVEHARRGSSDAFAELYVATYQKQYRFACSYLRDEYLAQDAIQDTYMLVLRNISALKDANLFISWLNQITFRVCFKLQKKQKEKDEVVIYDYEELEKQPSDNLDPEEYVVRIDEHDFIIRQIMNLPFTESQIIILRYYNNLKIKNIARLMDMSSSSVKRYLASGRRKLKLLLNDEKGGEAG